MSTLTPRSQAQVHQLRKAVEWAERMLELSDTELGPALGASPRSVARWRDHLHRPTAQHLLAAERLLELAHALDEVFGRDAQRLQDWLHEPLPVFRGRTPLRMIINGEADKVLTVLANIDSGTFA